MTFPRYRWQPAAGDDAVTAAAARLAATLNLHPVVARLLCQRGYSDPAAAQAFLNGSGAEPDPFALRDMDRAVAAIWQAVADGERILVFGDYDADGLAATALLTAVLRAAGADVAYQVPHRLEEGYGLSAAAVEAAAGNRVGLIVTVDCGITAVAEAALAAAHGVKLVITDHHESGPALPAATAVINPHRPDCGYPEKTLSGTAVAYKLAQALARSAPNEALQQHLAAVTAAQVDLVALGTVADVMPLTGENRQLVRAGLQRLSTDPRPGVAALLGSTSGPAGTVSEDDLAFTVAPRLNAAGRLGRLPPNHGVDLLLADAAAAGPLAAALESENRRRQKLAAAASEAALAQAEARLAEQPDTAVLIVVGDDWVPGIVGIVAARVLERTGRPVAVLTREGDGWHGSARGPAGANWPAWLEACRSWLGEHGGHQQAAGFSVLPGCLEPFAAALERAVAAAAPTWGEPELTVDMWLDNRDLTLALAHELRQLAPFGPGNPEPVFGWKGARVQAARAVGQDRSHLKLRLQGRGRPFSVDAIGFKLAASAELPTVGSAVDVVFHLRTSAWQGRTQVDLHIRDYAVTAAAESMALPAVVRAGRMRTRAGATGAAADEAGWPAALQDAAVLWELPHGNGVPLSPVGVIADRRGTEPLAGRVSESQAVWVCGTLEQSEAIAQALPAARSLLPGRPAAGQAGAGHARTAHVSAVQAGDDGPDRHWVVPFGALSQLPARARTKPAVLLAPPPTWDSWRAVSAGRAVELAFTDADAEAQRTALAAYAPDRAVLAECFRLLRDALPAHGDLREADWDGLLTVVPAATWRTAVTVFRELGFVVPAGDGLRWRPPSRRVELTDSPTYRARRMIWEESERLRNYFLTVTATELQAVTAAGGHPLAGAG